MATRVKTSGRPQGQLGRVLEQILLKAPAEAHARELALRSTKSGPRDQMVHLEVTGEAADGWGYADANVTWEHPYLYAPLQSTLPFKTPHLIGAHPEFTAGATAGLVLMQAQVIRWLQDSRGWFIGAVIRIATSAPGQSEALPYAAQLHLTFTGHAYPTDEELST